MRSATSTLLGRGRPANLAQLTDQLRRAVRTGVFVPGDQLPTIRQLSDETGLATNVISRAFSNLQAEGLLVSRKRAGTFVRADAAERSAFDRCPRVRVFALVGPELTAGYYPLLQRGLDLAAGQRGYQIIASSTRNDVRDQADIILQLIDKSVSGVALVPATVGPSPAHHIRQLQRARVPVVLLHRGVEGVAAPLLRIPAEEVGRLAGERLLGAGHRRIALVAGQRAGTAMGYERGLRVALRRAGVEMPDPWVFFGDMTLISDRHYADFERAFDPWFDGLMRGPDRPTAVFTTFESIGEIAYLTALRRGLRLPDDLAIVTVGGKERRGAVGRRLACVTLDEEQAGQLTAQLLDEMCCAKRPLDDQPALAIRLGFDPAETLAP